MSSRPLFRRPLVPALLALSLVTTLSAPQPAHAQTAHPAVKSVLTPLHQFDFAHGATPVGSLTQGTDGNFYGMTQKGGVASESGSPGCGTIFKMTPAGQFTTLWRFNGPNGRYPSAKLTQGKDGNFYGTTYEGGKYEYGTVFRITPQGKLTTLHVFSGPEGFYPDAGLLLAPDGSFYGTTSVDSNYGAGSIFHMTPDGHLTVISEQDPTLGSHFSGTLVFGPDGALYGTAEFGGLYEDNLENGVVFRATTDGSSYTVLHTFHYDTSQGADPVGGVKVGPDGALYGVAGRGGAHDDGVVYKVTPGGTFKLLHSFTGGTDGNGPYGKFALGKDGNFYGVTGGGGTSSSDAPTGKGVVYRMTPTGTITTLYKFQGSSDGSGPGSIVFGTDGALYGTTFGDQNAQSGDGTNDYGTLFKLTLPQ